MKDGCGKGEELRLYEGATPGDAVEGMFSFFPCLPANESQGFPRPAMQLPAFVNPALKQGIKSNGPLTQVRVSGAWRSVARQILAQKLCLGISAQFPHAV
jgi:hypothetical protein